MPEGVSYAEVVEELQRAPSPTERRLYFAALLGKAADIPTDDIIIVGGSAIEFYTVGEYTSGDIDIVSNQSELLRGLLREWRFQREGRVWANEEIGIVVDFVRPPYTGDQTKTQEISTPYGAVRVAALEDLLVKRLASTKHWKRKGDFNHARLLVDLYADQMDWDYIEGLARDYHVEDVLAFLRREISSDVGL